jgi:hypothetical protein
MSPSPIGCMRGSHGVLGPDEQRCCQGQQLLHAVRHGTPSQCRYRGTAQREWVARLGEMVSAQDPVEVVDLVCRKPRDAALEDGDATVAIDVLMLDVDDERAVDEAADVEEAETSLVLLVGLVAGFDDARVEERDHVGGAGRAHDSRCAFDADLRRGDTHALAEGVDCRHPLGS